MRSIVLVQLVTLDGTKTHKLVLEGLFGTVYRATSTKKLIDKNQLSKLTIKCLVLKHNEKDRRQIKGATYLEEMEHIVGKRVRNNFIRNLWISVFLYWQYSYSFSVRRKASNLYDEIVEKANDGRKVFFVYGGTETNDRERIRAITEKLDNTIIVASYGTFSTGINIRNLHNIIFSRILTKDSIRILQSIGRGLRLGEQKQSVTVYDIADDLSIDPYKNFTLDHFDQKS